MQTQTLTEIVKSYQVAHALSDGKLANLLGIHRTTWLYIKSGRTTRPSERFLRAVGSAIPELLPQVIVYLTTPEIKGLDSSRKPAYNGKRAGGTARK